MRTRTVIIGLAGLIIGWFIIDAGLHAFAHYRAKALIRQALGGQPAEKAEAIEALLKMDTYAAPAAMDALQHGDAEERRVALLVCEGVISSCVQNFHAMNCVTGYVPGRGAARRTFEEIQGPLAAALADGDEGNRIAAARIILPYPEFPAPLRERAAVVFREILLRDPDPASRRSRVETTFRLRNDGLLPLDGAEVAFIVLAGAAGDEDISVRRAAIEALGRSKYPEAMPPILAALKDMDASVRNAAERACLARVIESDPRWARYSDRKSEEISRVAFRANIPYFIGWLRDSDSGADAGASPRERRMGAIKALSWAGGLGVIPPLIDVLRDQDGGLRDAAMHALGQLSGDREENLRALSPYISEIVDAMAGLSSPGAESAADSILFRLDPGLEMTTSILFGRLTDPGADRAAKVKVVDAMIGLARASEGARRIFRRIETEEPDPQIREAIRSTLVGIGEIKLQGEDGVDSRR